MWAFAGSLAGAEPATTPGASRRYEEQVRPFLVNHCVECHSGREAKGHLALDDLSPAFQDEASRLVWLDVVAKLKKGEMPPTGEPRPAAADVQTLEAWVHQQLETAARAEQAPGRVIVRRLNRVEYENTMRDLLGIEVELRDLLPIDSSANGFDNVGEALHTSSFLLDKYLEAADKALHLAIASTPQPPVVQKRFRFHDERHVKTTTERVFQARDDALIMFSSSAWQAITLWQFYPPDRGRYRIRISAFGHQSEGRPVTYRVDAGPMLMGTKSHLVGYFDAPPEKAAVLEFVDHLEARSTIRLLPYGLATAQAVNKIGADAYEGAGLGVEWVEVEGPLHEQWPPESHRQIFGDLPQQNMAPRNARPRLEVVSQEPLADAERILRKFATRAYRRTATDQDLAPLLALVQQKLDGGYTFEQAVRVALKQVLTSPNFLFLLEKPGKLDDFALASRLSYFLWSTLPDHALIALAEQGKLSQPEVLREQVERMLASPKASAFTENFLGQWLGLRDLDFTEPDRRLYPEYDGMLRAAMADEAHHFFNELLAHDLSITNFVASDFTFLNERLARHYGIPGVEGHAFRKVTLPPESHRGGVMTMAGVLKVTANGTNTSPVVRGAWVLDRILGTPPKPPPAGVPAVEPDIRGSTTVREQLTRHREIETCASCHRYIDPPGFALESFDVIGGWRENYRSVGRGESVTIDGQRMLYYKGPAVDPADQMADGRPFRDIDELKQLLLEDRETLARSLTAKIVTYATGRAPRSIDQPEVQKIVNRLHEHNDGLRTLVHEIVASPLFQHK